MYINQKRFITLKMMIKIINKSVSIQNFKTYPLIYYHIKVLKSVSRKWFSLINDLRLTKINISKIIIEVFQNNLGTLIKAVLFEKTISLLN